MEGFLSTSKSINVAMKFNGYLLKITIGSIHDGFCDSGFIDI